MERAPMDRRERARLCRSWLFLPGADRAALEAGPASGADALIQEFEDFTPEALRPLARTLTVDVLAGWRAAGVVTAVRINPLASCGLLDLAAVMPAAPDAVLLPKCATPDHVRELDVAVTAHEEDLGLEPGSTILVPNVESALGLRNTFDIARSAPRVAACLVASEDMAADLGAVRGTDGVELAYVRAKFHLDCVAAGIGSIDCPHTWADEAGVRSETVHARRLGYRAKSAVAPAHAAIINEILTPSQIEVDEAREIVATFEQALDRGSAHALHRGKLIELPIYTNARRTLQRAEDLADL